MRGLWTALENGVLDARIIRWPFKLLYAISVAVIGFALARGLLSRGQWAPLVDVLGTSLDLAGIYYGSRIFRGRDEGSRSDRPLWQMTARYTASRRLGILFTVLLALQVASAVIVIVGDIVGVPVRGFASIGAFSAVTGVVEFALLAWLFRRSAHRLALEVSHNTFRSPESPGGTIGT